MRYKKKWQYLQQANERLKEQDLPRHDRSSNEVKTIPLHIWSVYPYLIIPTLVNMGSNWGMSYGKS